MRESCYDSNSVNVSRFYDLKSNYTFTLRETLFFTLFQVLLLVSGKLAKFAFNFSLAYGGVFINSGDAVHVASRKFEVLLNLQLESKLCRVIDSTVTVCFGLKRFNMITEQKHLLLATCRFHCLLGLIARELPFDC